jgi:D-alanine-D-alanine ligase
MMVAERKDSTAAGKRRIAVILGGRSGEHEVSLMSAVSVLAVLDPQKYEVFQVGITHEGRWVVGVNVLAALQQGNAATLSSAAILPDASRASLYAIKPSPAGDILEYISDLDVIFPVLHGTFGEDGALQGLLELADVAYVGAGVLASSVGMDKALFKDVMRTHNIPVVESITVTRRQIETQIDAVLDQAEQVSRYPLFVKPANLGSSVGVSKCRSRADLLEGLMDAARFDRRILVERGVNAREIEVSVLGNEDPQASVPGEIIPSDEFYSYDAKYIDNASELIIPAALHPDKVEELRSLAVKAYKAIDCAGMARVDFLLDKDTGLVFLSEINTIPGFTQISMYPKLWQASGITYPELVDRLIELALERQADRKRTEHRYGRDR